jgi:glucuronoarabinoxylan endo-1,4-beta-xylanase
LNVLDDGSPQNEPDYSGYGSPTCVFGALETANIPGYYNAATAVSNAVKSSVTNPPRMFGPDCTGVQNYLAEFPFGGGGQFAAIGGHLYGSGNWVTSFDPYSFNSAMVQAKNFSVQKGLQNLWMTEFAKLGAFDYQDPLRYAIIMQNAFTLADMSVYLHWDGAWGLPNSGPPTEGTMILVDNPFMDRSQWRNPRGYQILHTFWWFKHFTRFIRPTYRRVQCDISGLPNMLVTAWTGANGQFSIIFVNTGTVQTNITLLSIPSWIPSQITDRYFSTLDVGFTYSGRFSGNFISLPPLSITSLFSYRP